VQDIQKVSITAGISSPTDLAGQMAAALVAGTLALQRGGRASSKAAAAALGVAGRIYNVTVSTSGVVEHDRALWRSDSFYDDRLWAVRFCVFSCRLRWPAVACS
jgi:hypothetical protein